uniref:Uncharacterized protein n=1 Tax=Anguilla anguilla TaxID=7936 RepID=A0A0E9SWJ7_ANGAN
MQLHTGFSPNCWDKETPRLHEQLYTQLST